MKSPSTGNIEEVPRSMTLGGSFWQSDAMGNEYSQNAEGGIPVSSFSTPIRILFQHASHDGEAFQDGNEKGSVIGGSTPQGQN